MDVRYINPFIQAIRNVFQTMVHVEVHVGKPSLVAESVAHDVSGVIGFSGDAAGCVVLSFPLETACKTATAFAGIPIDRNHPDFSDAIGELTNMVAGSAKTQFAGMSISISLPSVILGSSHTVAHPKDQPRLVIPCTTDFGPVSVEVGMTMVKSAAPQPATAGVGA